MRLIDAETLRLAYLLSRPIELLGLSMKTYNALKRWGGVDTVGKLCGQRMSGNISEIRFIGAKSIKEIDNAISNYLKANGYEVEYETD